MAKVTIKDIISMEKRNVAFNFDALMVNPLYSYIPQTAIDIIRKAILDPRLSSKIKQKYALIDGILTTLGFRKLGCGTNRIVYECLYDDRIVMKIALDRVGIKDNPREFINQNYLKPHVCKIFETSPCGTVAIVEKVQPIVNRREFKAMKDDIFKMMISNILGKYVMDDIGIKFFMNYGLRDGFGPVIIDYPYVFPLDSKKLICKSTLPGSSIPCCGDIDYDSGFNELVCTKCGKYYQASDLGKPNNPTIEICKKKGKSRMKVRVFKGNKKILESDTSKESKSIIRKGNRFDVTITQGDKEILETKQEFDTSSKFIPEPNETKVTVDLDYIPEVTKEKVKHEMVVEEPKEDDVEDIEELKIEDLKIEPTLEEEEVKVEDTVIEESKEDVVLEDTDDGEEIEEYLNKKYGKGGYEKNRKKSSLYDQY